MSIHLRASCLPRPSPPSTTPQPAPYRSIVTAASDDGGLVSAGSVILFGRGELTAVVRAVTVWVYKNRRSGGPSPWSAPMFSTGSSVRGCGRGRCGPAIGWSSPSTGRPSAARGTRQGRLAWTTSADQVVPETWNFRGCGRLTARIEMLNHLIRDVEGPEVLR